MNVETTGNLFSGVDFHVHYAGTEKKLLFDSARRVIDQSQQKGLEAIGLLTRVDLPGPEIIERIVNYGNSAGLMVFPGFEYYAAMDGKRGLVDLIAFGFDYRDPRVREAFGNEHLIERNQKIAVRQIQALERYGFVLEPEGDEMIKLLERVRSGKIAEKAIALCRVAASTPENYGLIEKLEEEYSYDRKKFAEWMPEAPEAKFLYHVLFDPRQNGELYLPVQRPPREIIEIIQAAGGVVFYSPEGNSDETIIRALIDQGIDGVMGWHGGKLELGRELIRELRERGLLILGGSDYDPRKKDWQIGDGSGGMFISPRRLKELLRVLDKRNKIQPGRLNMRQWGAKQA